MRKTITILLFAGVLLTACAPAATPAPSGGNAPEQVAAPTAPPTVASTQAPAPTVVEAPTAAPTVPPTTESQPTAAVIKDTRQLVDVFMVSDPTTVNLAAGQPQLVEFFAFW